MSTTSLQLRVTGVAIVALVAACRQDDTDVQSSRAEAGIDVGSAEVGAPETGSMEVGAPADAAPADAAPAEGGKPLPVCAVDPAAPMSSRDPPRRTLPWTWAPAVTAGVPAAADAGAVPAPPQACTSSNGGPRNPGGAVHCLGLATVQGSGTNVALAFPGGSALRWNATVVPTPVSPPAVNDGATVWVDYAQEMPVVCPFCGTRQHAAVQIREREGGKVLWIGGEGHLGADLSDELARELFGVTARAQPICTSSFDVGCFHVERTTFDHVLPTTPEQTLHHAKLEHVTTPNGAYDVVWAASDGTSTYQQPCADGPAVASDSGFAVSRTSR